MTLSGTKDTTCFCGPDNPLGLQVPCEPDGTPAAPPTILRPRSTAAERHPALRSNLFDARAEIRVDNAEGSLLAESSAALYTIAQPAIRRQQKSVEAL